MILGLTAMTLPKRAPSPSSEERTSVRELLHVPAFLVLLASGWFSSFAGTRILPGVRNWCRNTRTLVLAKQDWR